VELTNEERARISDSKHMIQSVTDVLTHIDGRKIPDFDEIVECLENADQSLRGALRLQSGADAPKADTKE
jgi:hypothetical protein